MDQTFKSNFRRKLLQWYQKHKRDLPWRKTRDPYAIWVSEIMLQQTQVATVIPFFRKFLNRFPTLSSLAMAEEEEVLARWAGLGYYRRAKQLHAGAKAVLKNHSGQLPTSNPELLAIPGIGPYTAGAIASIAFQRPEPLVDGNVIRVFSRLFRLKGHAKDSGLQKKIWEYAAALLDPQRPGDFNQALMELGATVCRVALPACERCPVQEICEAAKQGNPEDYPETPPATQTLQLHRAVALCRREGKILLIKRRESRWFQGLWELPHEYVSEKTGGETVLQDYLKTELGVTLKNPERAGSSTHGITHHKISSTAYQGTINGPLKPSKLIETAKYFTMEEMLELALPNFDRKVLEAAKLEPSPVRPQAATLSPKGRGAHNGGKLSV